jgi:hypothetical protein
VCGPEDDKEIFTNSNSCEIISTRNGIVIILSPKHCGVFERAADEMFLVHAIAHLTRDARKRMKTVDRSCMSSGVFTSSRARSKASITYPVVTLVTKRQTSRRHVLAMRFEHVIVVFKLRA